MQPHPKQEAGAIPCTPTQKTCFAIIISLSPCCCAFSCLQEVDCHVGGGTYQSYLQGGPGAAPVPAYSGSLAPTAISATEVGYVAQSGAGLAPSSLSYQEVTGPG